MSRHSSNIARALAFINHEAKGNKHIWPDDASNKLFVGHWKYWYRENGMRTSTDDVLASYVASVSVLQNNLGVKKYVDLGCGIGSILLLTAHKLLPNISLGIEAQKVSINLLQRTLDELPIDNMPFIKASHQDLRNFYSNRKQLTEFEMSLLDSCDLITANPPYSPISGTFPKDPQRLAARFEVRGGVEEYLEAARELLSARGKLFLVFWTKNNSDSRIRKAVVQKQLIIMKSTNIIMGKQIPSESKFLDSNKELIPTLIVYEIMKNSIENMSLYLAETTHENVIDIRVPQTESGGYHPLYRDILKFMDINQPLHISK